MALIYMVLFPSISTFETPPNWEPYLALMPVTAKEGDLAAGDTSVGLEPHWTTALSKDRLVGMAPPSMCAAGRWPKATWMRRVFGAVVRRIAALPVPTG
jgi:hypothetical protein